MDKKPYSKNAETALSDQTIEMLNTLSHLMDKAFTIPGTNMKMGLDSILGFVPLIGDTLGVAVSGYIYSFAKKAGVPWHKRMQMLGNIFIDWLIGIVPLIGDLFDIGWKANSKNVAIINAHHQKRKNADIIDGEYTKIF